MVTPTKLCSHAYIKIKACSATVVREALLVCHEREKPDVRDTKFKVPGSKFRKPRTSDFELLLASLFLQVSSEERDTFYDSCFTVS